MKSGFFFITVAVLLALIIVAGCKLQAEPPNHPIQPYENATDCASASDCGVGGCSGQVCTTAKEAPNAITTCEYREEYGCLKLTSCGCANGKCMWQQNTKYADCLDAAKSKPQ